MAKGRAASRAERHGPGGRHLPVSATAVPVVQTHAGGSPRAGLAATAPASQQVAGCQEQLARSAASKCQWQQCLPAWAARGPGSGSPRLMSCHWQPQSDMLLGFIRLSRQFRSTAFMPTPGRYTPGTPRLPCLFFLCVAGMRRHAPRAPHASSTACHTSALLPATARDSHPPVASLLSFRVPVWGLSASRAQRRFAIYLPSSLAVIPLVHFERLSP